MRVAIYTRVSTDGQSVSAQLTDLRETAERRGWEIVQEYTDRGISGAKGRDKRPGLDAMLKAATRSEFDMVAAGLGLYVHKQGLDTSMPSGRAMFGIRRSETTA